MEPRYLIDKLVNARTLQSKQMAVLFEALRIELGSDVISINLRDAYLAAFYRGFPVEQFHPQSIMGFYVPYAMRAFLTVSKFSQGELELGQALYKFCTSMTLEEVADIRVFWGIMHGRPALIKETLSDLDCRVQSTLDPLYSAARLKALTSIANNEAIDDQALKALVSSRETKWDGLPWIKWQFDNISKLI